MYFVAIEFPCRRENYIKTYTYTQRYQFRTVWHGLVWSGLPRSWPHNFDHITTHSNSHAAWYYSNKSRFSVKSQPYILILHYCHLVRNFFFLLFLIENTVYFIFDSFRMKSISNKEPNINSSYMLMLESKKKLFFLTKKYQQNFEGFFWSSTENWNWHWLCDSWTMQKGKATIT